jgi:ribose-phosphate pyrophosphokinase
MTLTNPFPHRVTSFSVLETKKIESWVYPGGEVGVRVPETLIRSEADVFFRLQSPQDIITLLMAVDATRRSYPTKAWLNQLIIPYIPYARQDRVATKGDPLAIKVLVDLIALTGTNEVHCLDPHSEVTEHYFEQKGIDFYGYSPVFFIEHYINKIAPGKKVILVSPDKGAKKKTLSYLEELDAAIGVIVCRKSRDPVSGKLTQAEFEEYIPKQLGTDINIKDPNIDLVITDDICDGGRTFMNIVELLDYEGFKNPVHLWTSHAIYSYGIEGLLKKFKTLGSTNSFLHKHIHENLITIPLSQQ